MDKKLFANISILVLFIFGFFSMLRTLFLTWNTRLQDFQVIYSASHQTIHFYNPYYVVNAMSVNYSPLTLALFFPLVLFGFLWASRIWIILSALSLLASMYVLYKIKKIPMIYIALIFFLSVISFPFKFNIGMGQVNIVLLFLLCLTLYGMLKNNTIFYLSFPFAVFLKVIPLIFIFIPIVKQNWKQTLGAMVGVAVFSLISLFFFSVPVNVAYIAKTLLPMISSTHSGTNYLDQSVGATVMRLRLSSWFALFLKMLIGVISLWVVYSYRKDTFYIFSLLVTSVLLISSVIWQHYLILLLIPFYYLVTQNRSVLVNVPIICSYVLISINIKNSFVFSRVLFGSVVLSHATIGLLGLWGLLILTRKQHTKSRESISNNNVNS